jgi:hypothetical protein
LLRVAGTQDLSAIRFQLVINGGITSPTQFNARGQRLPRYVLDGNLDGQPGGTFQAIHNPTDSASEDGTIPLTIVANPTPRARGSASQVSVARLTLAPQIVDLALADGIDHVRRNYRRP